MATLQDSYVQTPTTWASSYATRQDGQTWLTGSAYTISSVSIWLSRVSGGGASNLTVEIQTTSAGLPTGTVIATGSKAILDVTTDINNPVEYTIKVTPVALSTATTYAIVVYGGTSTYYLRLHHKTAAPLYADGTKVAYNGTSWATATGDAPFKTYSGGVQREFIGSSSLVISESADFTVFAILQLVGSCSLVLSDSADLNTSLITLFPIGRTVAVLDLDWSDEYDRWGNFLDIQGAGGGRYLITQITFGLDVNSDGIIYLGVD